MDMSPGHLWATMTFVGKAVIIVLGIMSVYSLWVMIERLVVYSKAKSESLRLLGYGKA